MYSKNKSHSYKFPEHVADKHFYQAVHMLTIKAKNNVMNATQRLLCFSL